MSIRPFLVKALVIFTAISFLPAVAFAQNSNLWALVSGNVKPIVRTWGMMVFGSSTVQYLNSASTTIGILRATNSTTTQLAVSGLTSCDTIDTDSAGVFRCGTDAQGAGSATTTIYSDNNHFTAIQYFDGGLFSRASSTMQLAQLGSTSISRFDSASSTLGNSVLAGNGTSTSWYSSAITSLLGTFTNLKVGTLSGILKGTSGVVGTASNGTDYTLITGTTCGGTDKVSAISAAGAVTCTADQTGGGGGAGFIVNATSTANGQVGFFSGLNSLIGDTLFSWDNTNKRLSVGTTTSQTHRLLVDGSIGGNLPVINCIVPWVSQTALTADQLGSATVQPFPCGGNYFFEENTDGDILPVTLANESAFITASGTPMLQSIVANPTAGAGAGQNIALLKSTILGSATTTKDGLIAEHWVQTPNVGTATTSVNYIFGFSDVSPASLTSLANYTSPKEGCYIVASSTANWRAVCRKNNVEAANVDLLATSTTAFEVTYQLNQEGFRVWINDDLTPRATIPAANIPVSYLRHFVGVGDNTTGSATSQGTLRVGQIKVWGPFH